MSKSHHKRMRDTLYAMTICSSFNRSFTAREFSETLSSDLDRNGLQTDRRLLATFKNLGLVEGTKIKNQWWFEWLGWPEKVQLKGK